jgi:hypothetical protein
MEIRQALRRQFRSAYVYMVNVPLRARFLLGLN